MLAETQRQAEEWESFISGGKKKMEGFRYALLAWESCRQANWKQSILGDQLEVHIWLFLAGLKLEQKREQLSVIKSWLSEANCFRNYCLTSWIVTIDSNLAS